MFKKNQIRQIQTIYWTVFVLLLVVGIASLLFAPKVSSIINWPVSDVEQFKAIIIIIAMVGVPGAFYLHNRRLKKIEKDMSFHNKISLYKIGFVVKMIVIEVFAILSSVGFLVTFQYYFLYLYAMAFILYLYIMPISSKIHQDIIIPDFDYEDEYIDDDNDDENINEVNFNNN